MFKSLVGAALLVAICGNFSFEPVRAEDNNTFECGRNLFKSKMYKDALPYFKSSERNFAFDNRAFYYEALCYHRMGQFSAAMNAYQNVISKFPDSDAAELSKKALAGMGIKNYAEVAGGSITKPKNLRMDVVPASQIVKVTSTDGKPVAEALVSGVKVNFIVDTSVADTTIGADVVKESKIPDTTKNKDYYLHDIKLGTMSRSAFPVQVSTANPKVSILGADYFESTNVVYDAKAESITVTRIAGFNNPFESGMKLFNANKLKEAFPLLKKASVDRARDPRAMYMYALCSQKLGKVDEARSGYGAVLQRFPNTEASLLSDVALKAIDPGYLSKRTQASVTDKPTLLGALPKDLKNKEFELPFTPENGFFKVNALIDGHNTEMYLNSSYSDCVFSTEQMRQIDPSYLDQGGETVAKPVDPNNSNNLTTTYTKAIKIRRVKLGPIEARDVPGQITDTSTRAGFAWSSSVRPILGGSVTTGWRWEPILNRRVIRFVQLQ